MNFKQEAARHATTLVKENDIVGLGAGSTMAYVAASLKEKIKNGFSIKLLTSSFSTAQLLIKENLPVLSVTSFNEIDIYFDGCDLFDHKLNALKSGGGIHTQEKLFASMAKQFVLVGDETKLVEKFDIKYPLVLEILPQAITYVPTRIQKLFSTAKCSIRISEKRDGPVITGNGNYLLDVYFENWPALKEINPLFKNIAGVIETSLFYALAHKAIIGGEKGVIVLGT